MIVDGRQIAADIFREVQNEITHLSHAPHFTIMTCAPDFATSRYLKLKKAKADFVGVQTSIVEFPVTTNTEELVTSIERLALQTDGIIVQLPLPLHIDTAKVVAAIPRQLDVDQLNYDGSSDIMLPPVVGAMAEIAERHDVMFGTGSIVVVGQGSLVGKPFRMWAEQHGWVVTVVDRETQHPEAYISAADILVLGAGQPHLITPESIKTGVVIFDAGTSEDNGRLAGDAHPDCAQKAALLTPVPGGIGPVTVAVLLRNVVAAARQAV